MSIPVYPITSAIPLQGEDYLPYVLDKIDSAKTRIWASIFIVDARVHKDEFNSVRKLIEKLTYATWRNVDVRVVLGTATIKDVYVACLTSAYYIKKQGISVKQYASTGKRKRTHSKYMLFDNDLVVVGSNNWTHESFHQAVNSSLAVESDGLNESLSKEFSAIWQTSEEVVYEN
jgi:phosphatidylserine/phosphatidylglycerophosphate/cardiolipin synthase-like enzyme